MCHLVRSIFSPKLYFIPINRNRNIIRLSELAHTAWRGEGQSHFHWIWFSKFVFMLRKRISGKTWLERYPAGWINRRNNVSVLDHEFCVCWGSLCCEVSEEVNALIHETWICSNAMHNTFVMVKFFNTTQHSALSWMGSTAARSYTFGYCSSIIMQVVGNWPNKRW